jgi:hypothetical protein
MLALALLPLGSRMQGITLGRCSVLQAQASLLRLGSRLQMIMLKMRSGLPLALLALVLGSWVPVLPAV